MMQEGPCGLIRKAAAYMDSLALLIPREVIPRRHEGSDIFRAMVSRLSRPEQKVQLFMTHKKWNDRAYLNIKDLNPCLGEEFQVTSIYQCEEMDFVKGYNERKPKLLDNTELNCRNGRFWMKASSLEFELKRTRMRTQEGRMILDSSLDGQERNAIKIALGVDGSDVRFHSDHSEITSMLESREGLVLTYRRTQKEMIPHRRLVCLPCNPTAATEWRHEFKVNNDGLSIAKPLELGPGTISVILAEKDRLRAGAYWASHESEAEKKWHQGDIGESVVLEALKKSGFRIFCEHTKPILDRTVQHKSENNGMDAVIENAGTYHVVSAKHWLNPEKAIANARGDIERFAGNPDRIKFEQQHGIRIVGGIAVEVFWSYGEPVGIIYTDYIKF
jgi:hypothetical protein